MTDDKNRPDQSPNTNEKDRFQIGLNRRSVLKAAAATGVGMSGLGGLAGSAAAAPGDQIGQVSLPSHSGAVGITFDGQYVYTLDGLASSTLQVYTPPAGGNGTATLEAEKAIVDPSNNSVTLSAVEWDPTRSMLWGGHNSGNGSVYLVDVGDPTDATEDAEATLQFTPGTGGNFLLDGLAYDAGDDTLWYSPDVNQTIWHFQPDGTQIGTIQPKNADGNNVGVSGVAVGADLSGRPTLYIGKHGPEQILRVHADDGSFVSDFATAGQRIEDLACDPVTYDSEAILTIFTNTDYYLAFEVEDGTCPIAGQACEDCPEDFTFKYEWVEDEEAEGECEGEFVIYDDDDNVVESVEGLELVSVTCDEDGEPEEACFETPLCEVEYEVKAGRETETETVSFDETGGEFCVSGIEDTNPQGKTVTHAISNIVFSCPEESD